MVICISHIEKSKLGFGRQASQRLGIISKEEAKQSNVQMVLAKKWKDLLEDTELKPIDVHTPMWLWSRGKFTIDV